jgi:hypothetical protein
MSALALAVCASLAQAQVQLPPCIPGITGKAVAFIPTYTSGTLANHVYWKCLDPAAPTDPTKSRVYGFSCLKEVCSLTGFSKIVADVTNSSSKVTTAKKIYTTLIKRDCSPEVEKEDSPFGKMCAERTKLMP